MHSYDNPSSRKLSMNRELSIRICLIEDDARLRQLIARWLQHEPGFQIINQYSDAESAVIGMPRDQPDVALVDINLPGQSGIDCVRQLKRLLPGTQFGIVTVYEDADRIFQALAAGATGYLLKQTPRAELIAAIRELNHGGSPMSTSIARKVVQSFHHPPPASPSGPQLSAREQQVLDGLVRGDLYKEIADTLSISMGTLHTYIRRIYEKLHVHSRAQAAAKMTGKLG